MYSLHKSIRQTSSALLYFGTSKEDHTPVALKFVTNKQAAQCEFNILDQDMLITGRNHIVKSLNYFQLQNVNCGVFVLEYLKTDLFQPTTTRELVKYINDIADAIKTIHAIVIIYADMKPEHILYNKQTESATLIDFGLCINSRVNPDVKGIYGTLPYMAPEVLQLQTFTNKIDIWGFGLSVLEMVINKWYNLMYFSYYQSLGLYLEKRLLKNCCWHKSLLLRGLYMLLCH
jgi:serine/threonine protein kinase